MTGRDSAAVRGPIESAIFEKLQSSLQPRHLEVANESHMHSVPPGSETHFRVVIVAERFEGLTRIARQRLVNQALEAELAGGVHALTQRCLTPLEAAQGQLEGFQSPECRGGSKA